MFTRRTLIATIVALVAIGGALYFLIPLPQTYTVYFVRDDGVTFSLQPVTRRGVFRTPVDRAKLQIEALMAGPAESEAGLATTIPANATPLAIGYGAGELTVDFPEAIGEGGGTAQMLGRINQLHYTLTETPEVTDVLIFVKGERITRFSSEGIIIDNPWQRDNHPTLPRW